MGRACSMHRRYEKDRIIVGKLEVKIDFRKLDVDGMIILKCV